MTKSSEEKTSINPEGIGAAEKVLGDWNGVLEIPGMPLLIVFHILDVDGNLQSTMDSPDQGANGIPMNETTYEDEQLKIVATSLGAEYTAELNEAGDSLVGVFKQNGMTWDLIMTREEVEREEVVRPQEPKDFPYIQEEVKFKNPKGGHRLAGTLTMPNDGKFEKVVVLISGSGPQDRNEEVLTHKPFLVLSDHLTRKGIAVLRYDDRGVAESEGEFSGATSKDFADDAAAAVAYLKGRNDMKGKAIGLVGHSEGGMIAPIVASENKDVDFIVLLAGPGIEIPELLLLQQDKIGEAEGMPEASRKTMQKMAKDIFAYIEANYDLPEEQITAGLTELVEKHYDNFTEEEKQMLGTKENFINQQTRMLVSEWYLYFTQFTPDDYLSKVKCPVLAVNGELDLQVTSKENLEGIRKSLAKAKNKNVTIHEFKGLNHLFQKTTTGAPSEYAMLEETFNEEAMNFISNWLLSLKI
ncbi:MAG: alpha/beta hydrolase [Bacteroidetes bacterium]|nr:MAG: alpha/beta hydrolase [Bacteroidota bacterium]